MLLTLTLLVSCRSQTETPGQSTAFVAMDTPVEFTVYGDGDLNDALLSAKELVLTLEKELSVTDPESAAAKLNRDGSADFTQTSAALVSESLALCERTGGALDISIYPALRAWGFTTSEYRVPGDDELASLMPLVDYRNVRITAKKDASTVSVDENMMLDFGAVAKGYAADLVCDRLRGSGIESALINLGGNVQTLGKKPDGSDWRIAVADPENDSNACVISVSDRAIVTSGAYERYFESDGKKYCHIIDPATLRPVDGDLLSVTVIAGSGLLCDAYSTAMFVMGFEKACDFWRSDRSFDAVFITADGIFVTPGIADVTELRGEYAESSITVIR